MTGRCPVTVGTDAVQGDHRDVHSTSVNPVCLVEARSSTSTLSSKPMVKQHYAAQSSWSRSVFPALAGVVRSGAAVTSTA